MMLKWWGNIIIGYQVTQVTFTNCAPFTKFITKIDRRKIDDAEELDLVMPMCNLIEYGLNYSVTARSSWFHSKDEAANFNADIANNKLLNLLNIRLNSSKKLKLMKQMEFQKLQQLQYH